MQLFVKEASFLLQDQIKQKMLSYLNDNYLIDLDGVDTVVTRDNSLHFDQASEKAQKAFTRCILSLTQLKKN
jgi:hypothetical protein